ncbi:MAG: AAA family ATPase, partial [Candidatus Nitrosopelagicus sp.]|nr:AAA family ATPase [Candidatus Nitrosopelagicus sp.]
MLRKIELLNFLSHGESEIALKPGITVFMGQNGSGKSSVIDAITFALFGKHTRPNNKGLVKYREAKGQASVEFTSGDKIYKAVRSLTAKGTTEAKLYKITEGKEVLTAQGERSQLGNDTMSNAIESIIGLDFDKIRISSIVQQGELEKIIKAKPKEFKELLNSIITIDKLDLANLSMKGIKEKFRSNIKEQYDYDDEDLGIVSNKITEFETIIKDSEPLLKKLQKEKTEREKRISDLKQEVEKLRTQELKVEELESRKNELIVYAREKIVELRRKNLEIEEKIEKCNASFSIIDVSGDVEPEISQGKASLEKISEEFLDLSGKKSKFTANVSLAEKITLK